MPATNETISADGSPQVTALIMAIIRVVLIGLGAAGITVPAFTDATLVAVAGAVSLLVGSVWAVVEQFRQARLRRDSAVASAKGGRAVQHIDYEPVAKPMKLVRKS